MHSINSSLSRAARIFQNGHLFPDVPHEENSAILGEEGCRSGICDWYREAEPALCLVPKLPCAQLIPLLRQEGWLRHLRKRIRSEAAQTGWSLTRNVSPN